MSDFDRIRPPGEPGSSSAVPHDERDAAGRAALFSGPPGRAGGGRGPAGSALHCSRCGVATPLGARTLLRAALPLFLVAPWRRHPVFAVCPACRRRAWLRVAPATPDAGR